MFDYVGFTLIKLGWLKLYQLDMVYVNSIWLNMVLEVELYKMEMETFITWIVFLKMLALRFIFFLEAKKCTLYYVRMMFIGWE
jgi:hypothetical protein